MNTDLINAIKSFRIKDQVEMCCQDCKTVIEGASPASDGVCPQCNGSLVGIRFYRDTLTRKVVYAEQL